VDALAARRARAGALPALVRLFGLSLTVLGLLSGWSIAFDLIAHQCGGDPACVAGQRSSQQAKQGRDGL
jgi:hypothetical protein